MPQHGIITDVINDSFDFDDLEPQTKEVKYQGERYILIEASEDVSAKWRNESAKVPKYLDGKVNRLEGIGDLISLLLSMTLCQTNEDGTVKLNEAKEPITVSRHLIKRMPSRVTKPMFKWVKTVSDLEEKPETREDLLKARKEIDEKLKALEDGEEIQDAVKNGSTATQAPSA